MQRFPEQGLPSELAYYGDRPQGEKARDQGAPAGRHRKGCSSPHPRPWSGVWLSLCATWRPGAS